MNHSVKRRRLALHQTHHHYYLNITVQAANLSDWRIESNRKNRFGSENRIETFWPELECSSTCSQAQLALLSAEQRNLRKLAKHFSFGFSLASQAK